jgi:murein L,D-transpeptidase YcbB/YkuD
MTVVVSTRRALLRLALAVAACGAAARRAGAQTDTVAAGLRLRLNVPAARIDVLRNDSVAKRFRAAVGVREYPTPLGSFSITTVEWNPWWIPPHAEWARGERPAPPGPTNPMGRVKLYFRPLYYLHGTPDSSSLGRAASHGCVRLLNADAVDLAIEVLRAGAPALESQEVSALAADRLTTRTILLQRPVALDIVHHRAELEGDSLFFHPDYYGRPATADLERLLQALAGRGYGPERVDVPQLRRRLDEPRDTTSVVRLSELVRPAPR